MKNPRGHARRGPDERRRAVAPPLPPATDGMDHGTSRRAPTPSRQPEVLSSERASGSDAERRHGGRAALRPRWAALGDDDRLSVGGRAMAERGGLTSVAVPVARFVGRGGGVSRGGRDCGGVRQCGNGRMGSRVRGGGNAPACAACVLVAVVEGPGLGDGDVDSGGGSADPSTASPSGGAARVAGVALPRPPPSPSGRSASPPVGAVGISMSSAASCPSVAACAAVGGELATVSRRRHGGDAGNAASTRPAPAAAANRSPARAADPPAFLPAARAAAHRHKQHRSRLTHRCRHSRRFHGRPDDRQ